jgi:hypothetical protein
MRGNRMPRLFRPISGFQNLLPTLKKNGARLSYSQNNFTGGCERLQAYHFTESHSRVLLRGFWPLILCNYSSSIKSAFGYCVLSDLLENFLNLMLSRQRKCAQVAQSTCGWLDQEKKMQPALVLFYLWLRRMRYIKKVVTKSVKIQRTYFYVNLTVSTIN